MTSPVETIVPRAGHTFDVLAAKRRCIRLRRRILEISQGISALHIAPAFSCLEIVDTVYVGLMRRGPGVAKPDTFILSKGHGAMAQYTVLEELGILSREDLERCCKSGGRLGAHPDYGLPGIEASTGSLGHGLGLGMGMALADRLERAHRAIYIVMSDGEMQEGSVWEALMLAPSLKLTTLIAFVDLNDFQSFDRTSVLHPNFYPLVDKTRAFGWETVEVDGHDPSALLAAVRGRSRTAPLMVIAKTTKGKGVSYMENVPIWHYRSPSPQEYQRALDELAAADAALADGAP